MVYNSNKYLILQLRTWAMLDTIKLFLKQRTIALVLSSAMVLIGIVIFVATPPLVKSWEEKKINEVSEKALAGLESEEHYLLLQARELDASRVFDNNVRDQDIEHLVLQVVEESRKRGLGGLLIADKNGIALSRANAVSQRGDFIFHTTVWGKTVAQGNEIASIEAGASFPLVVVGGVPMMREGNLFGAIIATHIVDAEYAQYFRDTHLPPNSEAVFVPKQGIVGGSFNDANLTHLFSVYFSPGSDFLETEGATDTFSISNKAYLVKNSILKGIEDSPGNLLIFTKPVDTRAVAVVLAFAIVLCIGGLVGLARVYIASIRRHVRGALVPAAGFVVAFLVVFSAVIPFLEHGFIRLDKPAYLIYNSTLELDPENITLSRRFEYPIAIKVRSGGEAINVAQAVLHYDPEKIKVVDILTTKSFCRHDFFIERSIDNENGEVRIACGLPTPGFSELEGIVAELLVQPLTRGAFSLLFDEEETKVLANDGLGTNVLRYFTNGSYQVAQSFEESGLLADEKIQEILIFSPTHPNQERWYNKKDINLAWKFIHTSHTVAYRYLIDTDPNTVPREGALTKEEDVQVRVDADGVYWFHILAQEENGAEEVAHYKLRIDSTPPAAPTVRASADKVRKNEIVRLEFSSKDEHSGLQRTTYVKFNGIYLPVGPQLYTVFPSSGTLRVGVRVFDYAGNVSETEKIIEVE